MVKGCLVVILLGCVLGLLMVYFGQDRMIYFPRRYHTYADHFRQVEAIEFQSGSKRQEAYMFPKTANGTPDRIWWLFGGNGSTALDWVPLVERASLPEGTRLILVDYPGYGNSHGRPSPESIHQSVRDLHQVLCDKFGLNPRDLSARSQTMGHSLGGAVALQTAAEFEMQRSVAVSPFTSMKDMAKLKIGSLHFLLKHHFDNRLSIRRIVDHGGMVEIFHGSRDALIPIRMGEELHLLAGQENSTFTAVPGVGHNNILSEIGPELVRILSDPPIKP